MRINMSDPSTCRKFDPAAVFGCATVGAFELDAAYISLIAGFPQDLSRDDQSMFDEPVVWVGGNSP